MNLSPIFCIRSRRVLYCAAMCLTVLVSGNAADTDDSLDAPVQELVSKVIAAAGGEDHLLTLFRMEEQYNAGNERVAPGTSRVSVVEPPHWWWIGTNERGDEPGKITAWAWTLRVLTHATSDLERIPDVTDTERKLTGLRVTGSVDPAIDMYFDRTNYELVRVDWRNDIYRFSEWREHDGTKYPSKCAMFRRDSGEPWFFHEIVRIERLKELPDGLKR